MIPLKIFGCFCIEGKVRLIRYEDLSINPFRTTDKLLKFLDLSTNKLIERFIEQYTQTFRDDKRTSVTYLSRNINGIKASSKGKKPIKHFYKTARNSKATAFNWRTEMEDKYISNVQGACHNPMRMLGYNLMRNIPRNKYDNQFPLITKLSKEIWPY